MPIVSNPDLLVDITDVVIDTATKTIEIKTGSAITNEGATGGVSGQALYSFLKDRWKASSTYIKYLFPLEAITPESFEFINGWLPKNDATRKLIRNAGWSEKSAGGALLSSYMGVVSLGTLGATDQPYYQFGSSASTAFTYQGPINEAVKIYGDAANGNFDYRAATTLKLFCREQGKKYAASNNAAIGANVLSNITYRFPLSNETDLKISESDLNISTNSPYTGITVEYFGANQMFDIDGDTVTEPYRILITDATGSATTKQIYEKIQYLLRQNSDIDAGAGSVIGKTADSLLSFVGDTLVGSPGVRIIGLNTNYINSVDFYDYNNIVRRYPFVAAGTINFNPNLVNDGAAIYRVFFVSLPGAGNDFGEAGAVLVKDKDNNDLAGNISGTTVPWSFNYDSNAQGGRTPASDAAIIVVAIGTATGQYASATHTITRGANQNITVSAALERNYVE